MSDERSIDCFLCKTHCGIIRDARLLVGLAFLCTRCQLVVNKNAALASKPSDPVADLMGLLLKTKKKT